MPGGAGGYDPRNDVLKLKLSTFKLNIFKASETSSEVLYFIEKIAFLTLFVLPGT